MISVTKGKTKEKEEVLNSSLDDIDEDQLNVQVHGITFKVEFAGSAGTS